MFVHLGIKPRKLLADIFFVVVFVALVQRKKKILSVLFDSGSNQTIRGFWGGRTLIRVIVQNNTIHI